MEFRSRFRRESLFCLSCFAVLVVMVSLFSPWHIAPQLEFVVQKVAKQSPATGTLDSVHLPDLGNGERVNVATEPPASFIDSRNDTGRDQKRSFKSHLAKRTLPRIDPSRPPRSTNRMFRGYNEYFLRSYRTGKAHWLVFQDELREPPAWSDPGYDNFWRIEVYDNTSLSSDVEHLCYPHNLFRTISGPICQTRDWRYYLLLSNVFVPGYDKLFRYEQSFSYEARTIIVLDNRGEYSRRELEEDEADSNVVYPAPNPLWEVAAIGWNNYCQSMNGVPRQLKYIVQPARDNDVTLAVGADIYEHDDAVRISRQRGPSDAPRIGQREYTPESPEFFALLGTIQGNNVLTFLANNARNLRGPDKVKSIASIKVQFGPDEEMAENESRLNPRPGYPYVLFPLLTTPIQGNLVMESLMFVLEDIDPPPPPRRRVHKTRD